MLILNNMNKRLSGFGSGASESYDVYSNLDLSDSSDIVPIIDNRGLTMEQKRLVGSHAGFDAFVDYINEGFDSLVKLMYNIF